MNKEREASNRNVIMSMVAAAVGGIAPNLIGLGILLTTSNAELPRYTFYLGLLIFAMMGGAIALIWKEVDPRRAFYLGIGLPALIQVSIGNVGDQSVQLPPPSLPVNIAPDDIGTTRIAFPFVSEAIAQAPMNKSESSMVHGRRMLIEIDKQFLTRRRIKDQLTLWYYHYNHPDPKHVSIPILSTFVTEGSKELEISDHVFQLQLDVPETARAFLVQIENNYSQPAELSTTPDSIRLYQLQYIKSAGRWSGLWRALGRQSVSGYQVQLRTGPHPDSPLISFNNRAKFMESRDRHNWFEWETFVDATDALLSDVTQVKYQLHSTFSPEEPATNRSTRFAISRVGWGSFWVHAIVSYSSPNRETHIQYYLDLRKGW